MTTRRGALGKITSGAVAFGAILAGGGLMRGCAPDAQVMADEHGHQVNVPERGQDGLWIVAWGVPLYVRRIGPDIRQQLTLMPPAPIPWLRRVGFADQEVQATVETVLQGEDNDVLILVMWANLRQIMPNAGEWSRQGGFMNLIYANHYDALGRIRRGRSSRGNLFSPTLYFADGRAFIRRASLPDLNRL